MKVKTKRHICAIISFIGFMITVGTAGGIEHYDLDLKAGVTLMLIGLLIFAAASYKGGYID